MEKEMSKRKLKGIETRKKLFEAAKDLVMERGIENVSVDSIVEAAGVSKGTFYVHFESKDALMAALVDDYTNIADMNYKLFLVTLEDNKSAFETLMLLAEKVSEFLEHSIGEENMRALYKAHLTQTINSTPAMSYDREVYRLFRGVLERGVEQGDLRGDIPLDSLTKHLILAIRGITFEWCIRYPDLNLKEQVLDHFKILLYGLKK